MCTETGISHTELSFLAVFLFIESERKTEKESTREREIARERERERERERASKREINEHMNHLIVKANERINMSACRIMCRLPLCIHRRLINNINTVHG